VTCSEDDDFEVLAQILEDLLSIGTNVDSRLDDFSCGKLDGQLDGIGRIETIIAVDQSFIKIEYDCLLV
jgi:hypothetical protein